jgi:dTDP-4-amino-4,6-dideoxygalactose transaminase
MSTLAIHGGAPLRSTPFPAWPETAAEDELACRDVVRSGKWWSYAFNPEELAGEAVSGGSKVAAFEREWAQFQGVGHALTTASGSGALEIVCRALGIEAGDEVITTPYTFIASCSCLLNAGALPVFVDIDPRTYNLNPELIEAAITPRTRAILVVHFGGNIADMTRIMAIARKHGLPVIEDAAQAHGGRLDGQRNAGGIGHAGIFSFQQSKLLTCGEGGAITTNDKDIAERAWSLRHYGRRREGLWYEHFDLGWNYRMTELQAALLLAQLRKFPDQQARRARNFEILRAGLSKIPGIQLTIQNPESTAHSHYLIVVRYAAEAWDGLPRENLLLALKAEGIPCLPGYTFPLYRNPLFQRLDFKSDTSLFRRKGAASVDFKGYTERCPVAEHACSEESIWLTQNLLLGTAEDTTAISRAFAKLYEHRDELRKLEIPAAVGSEA